MVDIRLIQEMHEEIGRPSIRSKGYYYNKEAFEKFFALRNEHIHYYETWAWHPTNVFVGLSPWSNAHDFATMCNQLITCALEFAKDVPPLKTDKELLRENLELALDLIDGHLPKPAPQFAVPWGTPEVWHYFSITMPETLVAISIALKNSHADGIIDKILRQYLPKATQSLGWTRYDYDAIKMGVSYLYSRLTRKVSIADILDEKDIKYILNLVRFPTVESGNGIRHDFVPVHHECVRSYYPLTTIHYYLSFYTFLFGVHTVNYENMYRALELATTDNGLINPALNTTKPSFKIKPITFNKKLENGLFYAKSSKVLTMRTSKSFASIVGTAEHLAYYEADGTYNEHAALWAMNKRLHNRHQEITDYTETSFKYESGLILFDVEGTIKIPSVVPGASSFLPRIGKTVILTLPDAMVGIIHSVSAFTELNNLKFESLTILFENNLVQLYYNVYVDMTDLTYEPYVVALYLPSTYCEQECDIKDCNTVTADGITAVHMNILGQNPYPDFRLTLHNPMDRTINQVLDKNCCYEGTGSCCFRQIVAGTTHDHVYARYNVHNKSYTFRFMENEKIHIVLGPKYLGIFNAETKNLRIANLNDGVVIESEDIVPTLRDLEMGTCKVCGDDH